MQAQQSVKSFMERHPLFQELYEWTKEYWPIAASYRKDTIFKFQSKARANNHKLESSLAPHFKDKRSIMTIEKDKVWRDMKMKREVICDHDEVLVPDIDKILYPLIKFNYPH